jgi:hypothetical protein
MRATTKLRSVSADVKRIFDENSIINGVHHLFAPAPLKEIQGKGQKGDFTSDAFIMPTVSDVIQVPDLPKMNYITYLYHGSIDKTSDVRKRFEFQALLD